MYEIRCVRKSGLKVWNILSVKKARWACRLLLKSKNVLKISVSLPTGERYLWYEGKWILAYAPEDDETQLYFED